MAGIQKKMWKTKNLLRSEKEPRRSAAVVGRMVQSIGLYGFKMPLLATSEGEVIDGQLRLQAAERLGIREVPVVECDGWSEEQIRGFRRMVNESAQWAEWERRDVGFEVEELDFELDLSLFDGIEIADLFDDKKPAEEDKPLEAEPERCPTCKRATRKKRAMKAKGAK